MTIHGIQKSQQLLKHLDDNMMFMNALVAQMSSTMAQADNLLTQIHYVSAGISHTWKELEKLHQATSENTR